jgi:CBS-domain-containing membrane protein
MADEAVVVVVVGVAVAVVVVAVGVAVAVVVVAVREVTKGMYPPTGTWHKSETSRGAVVEEEEEKGVVT